MVNINHNNILNKALICAETGQKCNAEYRLVARTITKLDAETLIKQGWRMDWSIPQKKGYDVYALYSEDEVQGMIALKHIRDQNYTHIHYAEVAPFNVGCGGVAACLFAIACKISWDAGNEGYVLFRTGIGLDDFYTSILNARFLEGHTVYIDSYGAVALINRYFKETNNMIVVERKEKDVKESDNLCRYIKGSTLTAFGHEDKYRLREAIHAMKESGGRLDYSELRKFEVS